MSLLRSALADARAASALLVVVVVALYGASVPGDLFDPERTSLLGSPVRAASLPLDNMPNAVGPSDSTARSPPPPSFPTTHDLVWLE